MKTVFYLVLLVMPLVADAIEPDSCGYWKMSWFSPDEWFPNPNLVPSTPSSDFETVDGMPGVVRHLKTGLLWQRCFVGQSWDEGTQSCVGSPLRMHPVHIMTEYTADGWRLPNLPEARSIVERCKLPAYNAAVFPVDRSLGGIWATSTMLMKTYPRWIGIRADGTETEAGENYFHFVYRLVKYDDNEN